MEGSIIVTSRPQSHNHLLTRSPVPLLTCSVFYLLSPVFCLLSSVSCLLPPVFCLLSSVFCLPSSVSCLLSSVFCPTRPSCPACHAFMSQLCKTNPILSSPKSMQPPVHPVIPTEGTLLVCRSGGICFNTLAASQIAYLTHFTKKSCPVLCKTNPISPTPKPMQLPLPQMCMKTNDPCPTRKNKPNQTQFPQRNTPPRPLAGRYATRNTKNKPNRAQFPAPSAAEGPSPGIHTPFTLLAQDDMNRDCFAERRLEQANAANRKEVTPLNVRCN